MLYVIWGLTGLGIVLGFLLGVVLGIRHDYRQEAIGTVLVGYTGEEGDRANLFLDLDEDVVCFEKDDFVVLRVKRLKARK